MVVLGLADGPDQRGEQHGEERATYALRRGKEGRFRIRVAVLHGTDVHETRVAAAPDA